MWIVRLERGENGFEQWVERPHRRVDGPVPAGLRLDAVQRLNEPGPKHEGRSKRHRQQRVLGLALDPRPHQRTVLAAVRAGARHIAEGQIRVDRCVRRVIVLLTEQFSFIFTALMYVLI